jgi:hypothetical protein
MKVAHHFRVGWLFLRVRPKGTIEKPTQRTTTPLVFTVVHCSESAVPRTRRGRGTALPIPYHAHRVVWDRVFASKFANYSFG